MNQGYPQTESDLGRVFLATENHIFWQGKVLVHRRSLQKTRYPGYLIGPGDRIEQGEDAAVSASREISEETGVKLPPEKVRIKAIGIHHHLQINEVWVNFICRVDLSHAPETLRNSSEGTSEWLASEELLKQNKVFPPSKFYHAHVLQNQPGVMYTNIEWRNSELVRVLSQTVVK